MAIDILTAAEQGELLKLTDVAELLKHKYDTVRAWTKSGKNGHVLEFAFDGACFVTTREALRIFLEAVNNPAAPKASRSTAERRRSHNRAMERLRAEGFCN